MTLPTRRARASPPTATRPCASEPIALYYCSARYYDSATFSFITKDPAKADGEESPYQYCGGDPVGKVDPSGEWAWVWGHYLTAGEATRRNIEDAARLVANTALEELATTGAAAVLGPVAKVPAWVRRAYEAYDTLTKIQSVVDLAERFIRPRDLLVLQRSEYAYYSPSSHQDGWWVLKYRLLIYRNSGGRWSTVRATPIPGIRVSLTDRWGRALVGARPVCIGWPRRVLWW